MARKSTKGKTKRYNLVIQQDIFDKVENIADKEGVTTLDMLKRFVRFGLFVSKLKFENGDGLLIRQEGKLDKHLFIE